jgi:hypothetical protein
MHLRLSPSNTPTPGRATQPASTLWDKPELPTSVDKALVQNTPDGNFDEIQSLAANAEGA